MDGRAWWAAVHGVAKSLTRLSDFTFTFHFHVLDAIFDALRAGFDHVVLIIKPAMLQDVKELFGDRVESATGLKIDYAFQDPARFTEGYTIPAERVTVTTCNDLLIKT